MASFSLKIRHVFGDTLLTERSIGAGPPVIIQLSGINTTNSSVPFHPRSQSSACQDMLDMLDLPIDLIYGFEYPWAWKDHYMVPEKCKYTNSENSRVATRYSWVKNEVYQTVIYACLPLVRKCVNCLNLTVHTVR